MYSLIIFYKFFWLYLARIVIEVLMAVGSRVRIGVDKVFTSISARKPLNFQNC